MPFFTHIGAYDLPGEASGDGAIGQKGVEKDANLPIKFQYNISFLNKLQLVNLLAKFVVYQAFYLNFKTIGEPLSFLNGIDYYESARA